MTVPARISLVALGVTDLGRSIAFYDALGWDRVIDDNETIAFYRMAGAVLTLFGLESLAEDAGLSPTRTGFSGSTLAINVANADEVDAALEHAASIGATITTPAHRAEWGGYSGYFADPDGYAWEVAHNPYWPLDERGLPRLP